ncbi:MAG: hypothetical protein ACK5MD_08925 [Flavobacteriales bacterium]
MNLKIFTLSFTLFIFLIMGCKSDAKIGNNNEKEVVRNNKTNRIYKEIKRVTKSSKYDYEEDVQMLDLMYKDLTIKIRYIKEKSYIQVNNKNDVLIDWQPVSINFFYDTDYQMTENDIQLLLNEDDVSNGYILFPSFAEEHRSYFLYYFNRTSLKYLGDYEYTSLKKGTFSFHENTKELYSVSDKKYILQKRKTLDNTNIDGSNTEEDISLIKEYQDDKKNKGYEEPNQYYIYDSIFIETKISKYKILSLEKKEKKDNEAGWHFDLPIIILKQDNSKYIKVNENTSVVFEYNDNCPADGYIGLVSKGNYFTVEQIFCADFLFVNSYATFKIDENSGMVYLYKYGETYTDRGNPDNEIPDKTWTTKDFGSVKFENVTEKFLINLRLQKR